MFERSVDYLCDVLDGKKSFDWPLLFLAAFLVIGSGTVIHGCLFDAATSTANPFDSGVRFADVVDNSGTHHCFALTEQDEYGGYTYDVNCESLKGINPRLVNGGIAPD
jgi:hypothetical protein